MIVAAKDFGCIGDGKTDDTKALQAFFDYAAQNQAKNWVFDWAGTFGISSPMVIYGNQNHYLCGELNVLSNMDYAAQIDGYECKFSGKIRVNGYPPSPEETMNYSLRRIVDGVRLGDVRRSVFDGIYVSQAKRCGVTLKESGAVNLIQCVIHTLRGLACGSASFIESPHPSAISFDFTNRIDSGPPNGVGQRSKLTCNAPADLRVNDLVRFAGDYYQILDIDKAAKTIDLYPWITDITKKSGTIYSCHGGAICVDSGDLAGMQVGVINGFHCGVSCYMAGIYGFVVGSIITHSSGVALATRRICRGGTVIYMHPEMTGDGSAKHYIAVGNPPPDSVNIQNWSVIDPSQWYMMLPKDKTGSDDNYAQRGFNGFVTSFMGADHSYQRQPLDANALNFAATNRPGQDKIFAASNSTVNVKLAYSKTFDKLWGYGEIRILRTGNASTIISLSGADLAAGYRLMGSSGAFTIPANPKGIEIICVFDFARKNWIIM